MRLWRDTGEAVEEALTDQRLYDRFRYDLFTPLWMRLPFVQVKRGGPVCDAPLELRDDAE